MAKICSILNDLGPLCLWQCFLYFSILVLVCSETNQNHLMLWKWVADVCHQEFELDRIDRAASILVQRSECQSYLLIVSIIILIAANAHHVNNYDDDADDIYI